MTMTSDRFELPFLQAGQAQKEVFHNEAVAALDLIVHPVVVEVGLNTPPGSPAAGACWLVGGAPTGDWTGRAQMLAGWTAGGWRFVPPQPGMLVWSVADACWAHWDGTTWQIGDTPVSTIRVGGDQVVGARQPAIAAPAGGATVDAEARSALAEVLTALEAHGLIHS